MNAIERLNKKILQLADDNTRHSGSPEHKKMLIIACGLNSSTTKKEFFVLVHDFMSQKSITDLSLLKLNSCVEDDFYSAQLGSTLDFQMLSVEQRSAKTHKEMVEKLSRWLEDFKTEFAADYAAIATPRKHNPARTLVNAICSFVLLTAAFTNVAHAEMRSYSIVCKNQYARVKGESVLVGSVSVSGNIRETILKIDGAAKNLPPMQISGSALRTMQSYPDGSVIRVGIIRGAVPAMSIGHDDKVGNSLWQMTAAGCKEHAE